MVSRRPRLACELYDSVTQLLFSTMLLARASHLKLKRTGEAGSRELPEMLADLENMSAMALAQMRALLSELQVPEPEWQALVSAPAAESQVRAADDTAGQDDTTGQRA